MTKHSQLNIPQTPSMRLEGKRALVVGASSGIGLACAASLAQAGAHVVVSARSENKLLDLVFALRAQGHSADHLVLDVSDTEKMEHTLGETDSFDILVNSAGLARHAPALDVTPADFDITVGLNFRGAFFLTRAIARKLIEDNKSGSLINISSQMAHVGGINRSVYAGTKHAVEGFTKSMAIEWGKAGIRVNTICPTFIRTALTEATFDNPEHAAWIIDKIKLGRVGQVEDIMGAVQFLASDAADMITGTSLMVDGGWTAD